MLEILQDQNVRIIFMMLISIPLSSTLKSIKDNSQRRIFSFTCGTILQLLVYGILPVIKIMGFAVLMFGIIKVKPKRCGSIVTVLSMVFLSYYHFYGLILRYGENVMDEGVLLMIMVCKYSLFAYACQDAHDPKVHLNKQKQHHMIKESVSLWEYFQYLNFLPTAVMGPPLDYRKYQLYIDQQGHYSNIPSPKDVMIENLKEFAVCAAIWVTSLLVFPCSKMNEPDFLDYPALFVLFYTIIAIFGFRFKYFTAWKIGMFSIHASGISYLEEKKNFHGVNHCNAYIVETTPHIRQKISNWNMTVQQWLRKCVYQRSPFKNKMYSSLYVFMISAFWHGYYIGYYFSFFMWFVQVYLSTQIFRFMDKGSDKMRAIHKNPPMYLKIMALLVSNIIFSHNATFFYLLDSTSCLALMKKMMFLPQILPILAVIIFMFVKPGKSKSQKQKEK